MTVFAGIRLGLVLILLLPAVRAMSVVPPTFAELVAESETIVRGTVIATRCEEFDSPQGRGIRTLVTFRVERRLKGAGDDTVSLTLLGGTVGKRSLRIAGMPEFHVGARQIVFIARNGRVFCPLIGNGHGRYHVHTDAATGQDHVLRDNGAPLLSLDQVPRSLAPDPGEGGPPLAARGLRVADFESQILAASLGPAPANAHRP
jgi:hypothetical protein